MNSQRRLLVVGYYGHRNTGDDVFACVASWASEHVWQAERVRFLAARLPAIPGPGSPALVPRYGLAGSICQRLAKLVTITHADNVLYLGGSLLDRATTHRGLLQTYPLLTRIRSLNLGAVGVSIGPARSRRHYEAIRRLLSPFAYIALRDEHSYELVRDMGLKAEIVQAFDVAVLLPIIYGPPPRRGEHHARKVLGVAPCHYERYVGGDLRTEKLREDRLIRALQLIARELDVEIKLFTFNGHETFGDISLVNGIASALMGQCPVEIIPYTSDPYKSWQNVALCDAFLSVRLHGALFAYAASTPFALVEYHPKCGDMLDTIAYPKSMRLPFELDPPGEVAQRMQQLLCDGSSKLDGMMPLTDAQLFAMRGLEGFQCK